MVIEYIYLILIIVLILCIIFLINLSYEYRITEGFTIDSQILKNYNNYNNYLSTNNQSTISNADIQKKKLNINENAITIQNLLDTTNNIKKQVLIQQPSYPIDKLIKTIKSKYNSQYLSTFAKDATSYGVLVNDKCFTVNGLCKDEYCILECDNNMKASDSQKFESKRIYTPADASVYMNVSGDQISNKNIYPFNIFKSSVNNKCLTSNDDGITVEQCNLNNIKQQWEISPNENICVLK